MNLPDTHFRHHRTVFGLWGAIWLLIRRRLPVIGYLILTGGIILALGISNHATQIRLHDGLVGSCVRVNVLRAQSNLSDAVEFNVLSATVKRELILKKTAHIPQTRQAHNLSVKLIAAQANKINLTELTDCNQAVNHPDSYKAPVAGPLGNVKTGKLNPETAGILQRSQVYIRQKG